MALKQLNLSKKARNYKSHNHSSSKDPSFLSRANTENVPTSKETKPTRLSSFSDLAFPWITRCSQCSEAASRSKLGLKLKQGKKLRDNARLRLELSRTHSSFFLVICSADRTLCLGRLVREASGPMKVSQPTLPKTSGPSTEAEEMTTSSRRSSVACRKRHKTKMVSIDPRPERPSKNFLS